MTSSQQQHPAHKLLLRAHSPETASQIFTDKVKNKPLFLERKVTSDKRALRRHIRLRKKQYYFRKQKPQPLSAKEKRSLGLYKLQKEEVKYDIYKGLNEMWRGYVLEVLGISKDGDVVDPKKRITPQASGSLLASADFHGAEIDVVRSKDVGKVGIKGIVVRDTKFTFVVVTSKDEVKTIPKKDTVFQFEIPIPTPRTKADKENNQIENKTRLVFELHGNQFEIRPAERANRKFKWRTMDYL